jgi:hypothetical protein
MGMQIARWRWTDKGDETFYMERWRSGDYVLYEDHEKALATLHSENERLKAQVTVAELKRNGVKGLVAIHAVEGVNKLISSRTQATQKGSE